MLAHMYHSTSTMTIVGCNMASLSVDPEDPNFSRVFKRYPNWFLQERRFRLLKPRYGRVDCLGPGPNTVL